MTASVGQGVASVATAAATAATAAAPEVAAGATPLVVAATRSGLSGTGVFGVSAGVAGLAITLLDAWKSSMGSERGFTAGSIVNHTTMAIGGGAALLTLGEKTGATNAFMRNGMRGLGVALVLGGLAGAIVGAYQTFGGDLTKEQALASSQSQTPKRFGTTLPPSPANLAGVEVASADVIGDGRSLERVPVYVDPGTAKQLPEGTDLGEAIGEARAAAQADADYRSHAVIQTADDRYWTIRLKGGLDQVDGPEFATGTKFDVRYDPQIGRRQQALQAIAGVEGHYAFPEGMEPTAPDQYAGDIPWVTPALPTPKPTTGSPTATPTTPAPTATSPSAAATPSTTTPAGS